jgi:hypothetical protein
LALSRLADQEQCSFGTFTLPSYNEHPTITSVAWGVFTSATWGRIRLRHLGEAGLDFLGLRWLTPLLPFYTPYFKPAGYGLNLSFAQVRCTFKLKLRPSHCYVMPRGVLRTEASLNPSPPETLRSRKSRSLRVTCSFLFQGSNLGYIYNY